MELWDALTALAVPLIWIAVLAGRYVKNHKEKQAYYAAEDERDRREGADQRPIHPPGTNWGE